MKKQDIIRGILYGVFLVIVFFVSRPSKYHVTERYVFDVNKDTHIKLAILLPKSNSYQSIEYTFLPREDKYELSDYGQLQAIRLERTISKDDNVIVFGYVVDLKRGKITWDEEIKDAYYRPETDIESDNDILIAKAHELTKGTEISDAYSIYDFVSKYLEWPEGDRFGSSQCSQSALTAFTSKEGVCGEFANLMVALCRARGIPAKSISGLLVPSGSKKVQPWNHQAGAHACVEFYADGKWHFADPSHRLFNKSTGLYISYGDKANEREVYNSIIEWAVEDNFQIFGAMSAPLKFVASSREEDVTIIPTGTIKPDLKSYIPLLLLVILCIVIEKKFVKKSR